MKFSRHLSSHLTPEWRKQYIQYTELKRLVYDMVGSKKTILRGRPHNVEKETPAVVDQVLQEEFFQKVLSQLHSITNFYKMEETKLDFALSELQGQVQQLVELPGQKASQQRRILKRAVSEFYLHLILLQNYQQLNHTGFRKILKKYDKLAQSTRGGTLFKEKVCKSYFWTSQKVMEMISQVEKMMIQSLEKGDRSKAMDQLRVPPLGTEHKRSHWATYRAGLFSGVLIISVIIVCIAFALWPQEFRSLPQVEPSLIGLRAGLLVTVWFFGFATNTYGWRTAGVNNVLIFEFDPRNYLNFVQLFEVAGMVALIWMVGLYLTAFSPWLHIPIYTGPIVVYIGLVVAICLPLPILYYRSRLWLLKKLVRIACAPFFYVTFADFWIADQLTSLSLALLDTEYFLCYMFYGIRNSGESVLSCGTGSYGLRIIVASLPAWWRFAQCLRRYYDTRNVNPHLINAGKYSTSFFVAITSAVASAVHDRGVPFLEQSVVYLVSFGVWILAAVISTSYTFSWDILMDWSLFPNIPRRCCRKNAFQLRQDTIYHYKVYYVLALLEDLLFRLLWIFNISVGHHVLALVNDDITATAAGVLEIVRRFIWNFFRVENEHVNNVGQFRAVRDISLYPANLSDTQEREDEEEEEEEEVDGSGAALSSRRLSTILHETADRKAIRTSKQLRRQVYLTVEGGGVTLSPSEALDNRLVDSTAEERNCTTTAVTPHTHRDPHLADDDGMEMVSLFHGKEQANLSETGSYNYRALSSSPCPRLHRGGVEQMQNSEGNLVSISVRVEQHNDGDNNRDTGRASLSHSREDVGEDDPLTQTLMWVTQGSMGQRLRQRQRGFAVEEVGGEGEEKDEGSSTAISVAVDVEEQSTTLL